MIHPKTRREHSCDVVIAVVVSDDSHLSPRNNVRHGPSLCVDGWLDRIPWWDGGATLSSQCLSTC